MPQEHALDLASFVAAVLATFVAAPIAEFVGAYAAIVIGAVFGAGLSLRRAGPMTRLQSAGFIVLMVGVAVALTVGVAEVANRFVHMPRISSLLSPIALAIAAVGRDWAALAVSIWNLAAGVIERRYGGERKPPDGGRFTRGDDDERP
jgi:low affinity Fe/Cu permease